MAADMRPRPQSAVQTKFTTHLHPQLASHTLISDPPSSIEALPSVVAPESPPTAAEERLATAAPTPSRPRYLLETQRHKSAAQVSHRAHGAALREAALQQRQAARQKVEALTRHNKRKGADLRRAERSMNSARGHANAAYREHARSYVSELRELPANIKQTAAALVEARQARAHEVRSANQGEWERRRSENTERRVEAVRALHDEIRRSKMRKSTIPPEMEAEMRRLKIGPFAVSASGDDAERAEAARDRENERGLTMGDADSAHDSALMA